MTPETGRGLGQRGEEGRRHRGALRAHRDPIRRAGRGYRTVSEGRIVTRTEMERLWQVTGCAEPLQRARWSDTPRSLPRRRYSSSQDEEDNKIEQRCHYPDCDGGPATGYCHVDCRKNLLPAR